MPELTEKELEQIHETHDIVIKIKTVLLGANADKGLVGEVKHNSKRLGRIEIVLAILLGSGIVSGSIVGVIRLLL